MKGLLLKDVFAMQKQFRIIPLIVLFYGAFGYMQHNYAFMSGFLPFLFIMLVITTFSYDEQAKWAGFALALPISRRQLVLSKYVLCLLFTAAGFAISIAYGYIMSALMKEALTGEIFLSALLSSELSLLFISVMLPFIFRFGVEKSRIVMIVVFLILASLLFLLTEAKEAILERFPSLAQFNPDASLTAANIAWLVTGITIFTLLVFLLSFFISSHILKKQDF